MAKPVAIPLSATILLHLAVLLLLAFNFTFSSEQKILPQPKIIEAKLVSMEQLPALRAQPKPETLAEPKPVDVPPPVEKNKPEPQPEPKKPEPVKPEPPKPEPAKPDLEKQKQIELQKQLDKEKVAAEQKKLVEQKKQEDERKRKEAEEAQRKKQQEDTQRKAQEQREKNELAKAMAAEDNAMAAERDQEAIASFQGKIASDIESSWSRPPSARLGMQVTLAIQLIHTGEVINVSVVKSSGNDAFDQSAISAVRRVGKFPYLRDVSDRQFDKNFRPLVLVFNPTDLRQ